MPPAVTLVFPVYNQADLLRTALQTLDCTTFRDFVAVVVDDGSTEPILNVVEDVRRSVRYEIQYELVEHTGVSTVLVNRAFWAATTAYVAHLNSDVEFRDPEWLEATLQCFTRFPDAGIVGIKQLFPQDGLIGHVGTEYRVDGSWYHRDEFRPDEKLKHFESGYCEGVTGCGLVMAKRVWEQMGGFDVYYPHGWEDVAACLKVQEMGLRVVCQREHPIHHWRSRSYGAPTSPLYYENSKWIRLRYGATLAKLTL